MEMRDCWEFDTSVGRLESGHVQFEHIPNERAGVTVGGLNITFCVVGRGSSRLTFKTIGIA